MSAAARRPVVIITQARVGSSRLPAKVLQPMCGKPMLWWHLSRLLRARNADKVVVATTDEPDADRIVAIAATLGIDSHRGSLTDVMARFQGAADAARAASIVRVTSDCPLIDPGLIDLLIDDFLADPALDYASLDVSRFPRGLDCEIVSRAAFEAAAADATEPAHREHVTSFLRDHPARFKLRFMAPPEALPSYRWCVDTPEDFAAVERLLAAMLARDTRETLDFGWRDLARAAASASKG